MTSCGKIKFVLFTFSKCEESWLTSIEQNNIWAISYSQKGDRHHSNRRKFEKLGAGSSTSSACVELLDWNRYTLIGSKSDSSGGEMRHRKERWGEEQHNQQTPRSWNALNSKLLHLKRVLQTSCPHCVFIVCIIVCITSHFIHQFWGWSRGHKRGLYSP